MLKSLGFRKQLSFGLSFLVFVGFALSGASSYYFTASLVKNLAVSQLESELESTRIAVEVSTADIKERLVKLSEVWAEDGKRQLQFDLTKTVTIAGENQATHEKRNVTVPSVLIAGQPLLNSTEWVDRASRESGLAITIFLKSPEGLLRAATSLKKPDGKRAVGTFVPVQSPVYQMISSGKPFTGRAQVLGQWYQTIYAPVFVENNVVGAIFMGAPDLASQRIMDNLKKKKLLETGYFYIMDSSGTMILHPTKQGDNVLSALDLDGRTIFKEIIEKKNGRIDYRWLNSETNRAQEKLALFRYFPDMDWYVAASLNVAEAEAPLMRLRQIALSTTIAMTLLMVVITLIFGKAVVERFNGALNTVASSVEAVKRGAVELGTSSESLASGTAQQSSNLENTVSALDQIRAMTAANLDSTVRTNSLSADMESNATRGRRALEELLAAISKISENNRETGQKMSESNRRVSQIAVVVKSMEEKTKAINEIVFQTKLLSFNASVEAARAGESGRGFSVVAEEIGRLAVMSGKISEEIRKGIESSAQQVHEIINSAQAEIQTLVKAASESTEGGVRTAVSCQSAFEVIITQISQMHSSVAEINSASAEQAKGIEVISNAMREMEVATHQNSKVAVQSQQIGNDLDANSTALEDSMTGLKQFLHGGSYKKVG